MPIVAVSVQYGVYDYCIILIESMDGKQGDPEKAAEAIMAAIASGNPPLRLVLGKYANDKVRKKLAATANELAAWEHIRLPTDT
jgi:hypothetical protein